MSGSLFKIFCSAAAGVPASMEKGFSSMSSWYCWAVSGDGEGEQRQHLFLNEAWTRSFAASLWGALATEGQATALCTPKVLPKLLRQGDSQQES